MFKSMHYSCIKTLFTKKKRLSDVCTLAKRKYTGTPEIKMASHEDDIAETFSAMDLKPQNIFLPHDIILLIGDYVKFEDYRHFIQALWPNGDEDEAVQQKLWQLSTHNLDVMFFNRKFVNIEYNFDSERIEEDRILININSLLPVFGGAVTTDMKPFMNLCELNKFIKTHIYLNRCSNYQFASCLCHKMNDFEEFSRVFAENLDEPCEYGHFHHYCNNHVAWWIKSSVKSVILLQESRQLFNEFIAEQCASACPSWTTFFQTGYRATVEFLQDRVRKRSKDIFDPNL